MGHAVQERHHDGRPGRGPDDLYLEFISGGNEANLEDRIRQLQQHDTQEPLEEELSLRLLRSFAQSVRHQQYHDTDIIVVRVGQPGG